MKKRKLLRRTYLPIVTVVPLLLGADTTRTVEAAATSTSPPIPPAKASSAAHESVDAFAGTYRFVGGKAQRDARDAAIDEVVSEMNLFVRGIARDRLRESNAIPTRITMQRSGESIAIAFDDRSYEARLDGTTTKVVGITGDTMKYRVQVLPRGVRQSFDGEDGGRINTMKTGDEGRLDVQVEVHSSRLPRTLRYRLAFRRE